MSLQELFPQTIAFIQHRKNILKAKMIPLETQISLYESRIKTANLQAEASIKNLEDNLEELKRQILAKKDSAVSINETRIKCKKAEIKSLYDNDVKLNSHKDDLKTLVEMYLEENKDVDKHKVLAELYKTLES